MIYTNTCDINQEPTLVQNAHFDEVFDIDTEEEVSSYERDSSPDKKGSYTNDSSLLEEEVSTSVDVTNRFLLQKENNSQEAVDPIEEHNADVSNNFFDSVVDANDDTITSIETPKSSYAMEVGEVRKGVGDENSFSDKGLVSVSKNKSISVDDSRHNAYNSADSVAYQSSVQTSDTPSDNDEDVIGSLQSSNMFQKTYEELNISSKISNLFRYVDHMQPKEISLETELKCFIPPYVPTIGEVDPFIKVPRPDGKTDGLGLYVVDEPAKEQSDAAVLELQLRSQTKKRQTGNALVRSIENAERDPHEVDRWIQNIDDLRKSKPAPEVVFKHPMPSFDTIIMSDFRRELRENVRSGSISLPNPNMDLSLHDYSSLCLECQEFEENFDDNL